MSFRRTASSLLRARSGQFGPGGRSSSNGLHACVFGASGFLGRYVCNELGQVGTRVTVPHRGCELETRHLKPMFDLGNLKVKFYSPRERDSIRDAIADADVVINLIGKNYETRALTPDGYKTNYSLQEANVDIPRLIAEVSKEQGVKQFVHVSSASASPTSSSLWSRSKFQGEAAVRSAFPSATIVRPSQLFGPEDKLLNWFAIAANTAPIVPLIDGGKAITKPVYMGDVADAIFQIVDRPTVNYEALLGPGESLSELSKSGLLSTGFDGETFLLEGGRDFTYAELAAFVYDVTQQRPRLLDVPVEAMRVVGKFAGFSPYPMLTEDMVELWAEDFTAKEKEGDRKMLGFKDLGIEQSKIERKAFMYLHRFRTGGHFNVTEGWHTSADLERERY